MQWLNAMLSRHDSCNYWQFFIFAAIIDCCWVLIGPAFLVAESPSIEDFFY